MIYFFINFLSLENIFKFIHFLEKSFKIENKITSPIINIDKIKGKILFPLSSSPKTNPPDSNSIPIPSLLISTNNFLSLRESLEIILINPSYFPFSISSVSQ